MTRNGFGQLLNDRGLVNQAVEIGTHKGVFAKTVLDSWEGVNLWCVDPWEDGLPGYSDAVIRWPRRADFMTAVVQLAPYAARCQILRMTSSEAADVVPDELDFVYLDADHGESAVRLDISLWWPKLKSGGILAGHDYDRDIPGVMHAVDEHAKRFRLQLNLTAEDRHKSWYVDKP